MSQMDNAILEYLTRMRRNGALKGDNGSRSTREVADYLGLSMAATRRRLNRLYDNGQIEAFDAGNDHMGAPVLWQAKGHADVG